MPVQELVYASFQFRIAARFLAAIGKLEMNGQLDPIFFGPMAQPEFVLALEMIQAAFGHFPALSAPPQALLDFSPQEGNMRGSRKGACRHPE